MTFNIIKYLFRNFCFNLFIKTNKVISKNKKFKSISPKVQRRSINPCLKMKYKLNSKSQNKSRTISKGKMTKIEKNQINLLMKNKKNNFNMNNICLTKPRTLQ